MVAAATIVFMVAAASENNGRRGDHAFHVAEFPTCPRVVESPSCPLVKQWSPRRPLFSWLPPPRKTMVAAATMFILAWLGRPGRIYPVNVRIRPCGAVVILYLAV